MRASVRSDCWGEGRQHTETNRSNRSHVHIRIIAPQDGTPLRGEVRDAQDVKKAATIAGGGVIPHIHKASFGDVPLGRPACLGALVGGVGVGHSQKTVAHGIDDIGVVFEAFDQRIFVQWMVSIFERARTVVLDEIHT